MFRTIVAGAMLVASAAVAQTAPETTTNKQTPNADPNEQICRYQPVVGSRVNRIRVCRTRAEWANSQDVNARGNARNRDRGAQD